MKLHLASKNAKKRAELVRILGEVEFVEAEYPEPVEDGATFAENALIKARVGFAASGVTTLADDSGICVDALNGMPGVLSARWAGPPKDDARNNALLLAQLEDVPEERRGAYFIAVIAVVGPDGSGGVREQTFEGRMHGRVAHEVAGGGGFGYDPLFLPDAAGGRSAAELSPEAKDAISHRGAALRALAASQVLSEF